MSAGAFGLANYITDKGNVCRIKIQPETLAATVDGQTNANLAGTVNQEASAISSGRRGNGVFARKVHLVFTGAVPDGYKAGGRVSIPWLSKATFDAIDPKSALGTYLGVAVRCTGKSNETIG